MIDFKECIEKGLLKKIPASRDNALQSIIKAKELLQEAKEHLKDYYINSAIVISYLALFHAARAILFKEGFREKSHECIIQYLKEKHPEIESIYIAKLEKYKNERNKTQYNIYYKPNEEDAEKMVEFAEEFIQEIEEIV
ncbi:MAG: HEPN domain-containing protein [archaeon]